MAKSDYPRQKNGERLQFGGMDLVHPPDMMPPRKFPFAQNVRAYLRDRIAGRATQDSSVLNFPNAVHSIRRLNDTTPDGPASGYILIVGADDELYAGAEEVASGLSGDPLSLIPFRPNASVQPWMYVGDSALGGVYIGKDSSPAPNGMLKVRSDGLCYSMGIEEPQTAPTVAFTPISNQVSLLGVVTAYIWALNVYFNGGGVFGANNFLYAWKNPTDSASSGVALSTGGETHTPAVAVVTGGDSLQFNTTPGNGNDPVNWVNYSLITSEVNTNGTAVTWVSGSQFGNLAPGDTVIISTLPYVVLTATATSLVLTTSAGVQNDVNLYAAIANGTILMFPNPLGTGSDANTWSFVSAITGTLYIPAAGFYTLSITYGNDILWGIGGNAQGAPTWSGSDPVSAFGQTKTVINGYPLLPRNTVSNGQSGSESISVYFPNAGNYPIEIDWAYAAPESGSPPNVETLVLNAAQLGNPPVTLIPLPATVITNAQYRYTYRSSITGATSNPSPESPEQVLSVIANNVTAVSSPDPQVDKIDFYRLDQGNDEFTYVGTVDNEVWNSTTLSAVTVTGSPTAVRVQNEPFFSFPVPGQELTIDVGANAENIFVISASRQFNEFFITAIFQKTHLSGVPIVGEAPAFSDDLLDTDIASNPVLDFDNYQPFPSIDLPRSGFVDISNSGVLTFVAGSEFNTRWLGGTGIIVGSQAFELLARPTSTMQMQVQAIEEVGGIETVVYPVPGTNISYEIDEPLLAAQPLPYMWEFPTGNGSFFLAVGDKTNPGVLYWCKGNNPDSAPDTNQQNVTSPSEPLQNGCFANGLSEVFSTERSWLIYPNFFNALATVTGTEGSTWTLQESSVRRGLYIPTCLATEGGGMRFWRAKDGIYAGPMGTAGKSITDEDIYNIFPHEGTIPQPVSRAGFTVYPPDDTQPLAQKLKIGADGYLYYDYLDASGTPRTLVYDIVAGGWVWDSYQWPAICHAREEGPENTLTGNIDGSVRRLTSTGAEQATSVVLTKCENAGDTRAPKYFADIYIEGEIGN